MTDTIIPRLNADKSALFMSDSRMKCWARPTYKTSPTDWRWQEVTWPYFYNNASSEFHVGLTPPPPDPRMINWMGETFREPMTEAPDYGTAYFYVGCGECYWARWRGNATDKRRLANRLVHEHQEDCTAHSRALAKANIAAMEDSK